MGETKREKPGRSNANPAPLERPLHHHRRTPRLVAGVEDHVNFGGGLGGGAGLIPSRVEDEVIPEGSQPLDTVLGRKVKCGSN